MAEDAPTETPSTLITDPPAQGNPPAPPAESTPAESGDKPVEKPPEESGDYELTLQTDSVLDANTAKEITSWAKEQGLSKEMAQSLLDREETSTKNFQETRLNRATEMKAQWLEETKADKEIGGAKFDENIQIAKTALNTFADDKFKELLTTSGLGNHPDVIKFFVKLGTKMSSDEFVRGLGQTAPKEDSMENVFYGKQEK